MWYRGEFRAALAASVDVVDLLTSENFMKTSESQIRRGRQWLLSLLALSAWGAGLSAADAGILSPDMREDVRPESQGTPGGEGGRTQSPGIAVGGKRPRTLSFSGSGVGVNSPGTHSLVKLSSSGSGTGFAATSPTKPLIKRLAGTFSFGAGGLTLAEEGVLNGPCATTVNDLVSVFFSYGERLEAAGSDKSIAVLQEEARRALEMLPMFAAGRTISLVMGDDTSIPGIAELRASTDPGVDFVERLQFFAVGCIKLRAYLCALAADSDGYPLGYVDGHIVSGYDSDGPVEAINRAAAEHLPRLLLGRFYHFQMRLLAAADAEGSRMTVREFWQTIVSRRFRDAVTEGVRSFRIDWRGDKAAHTVWRKMKSYSQSRAQEHLTNYNAALSLYGSNAYAAIHMERNPVPNGFLIDMGDKSKK